MRIRKRFAPPPEESLHHQHHQPSPDHPPIQELPVPDPPRSDVQLTLVKGTNGWICKTDDDDDCMQYEAGDDMIGKLSSAPKDHLSDYNSSSAKHVAGISDETWYTAEMESAMKIMQEKEVAEDNSESTKKRRKKVDTNSVMKEGSRCSRVNGSGWRCWRQAAVGYSLCVHHSLRGRLRSKTSVKAEKQGHTTLSSLPVLLDEEPLIMLKKREKKKTGGIKNRSISSLLVQTQPTPAPPMPILDPATIF